TLPGRVRLPYIGRLQHHLECAVQGHQPGFDAQLRMVSSELLAKLRQRVSVGLRLSRGVGDGRLPIGNLGGATVTMVDDNDLVDTVQLDRGIQVVPERLVPGLERGRHDADRRARNRELAVLASEMTSSGVLADEFLQAWIDTGQDHRLILAARRKRGRRECGGKETAGSNLKQTASTNVGVAASGGAGAGGVVPKRVPYFSIHPMPQGIGRGDPGASLHV